MVVSLNITTTTDPVNFNVSYAYSTNDTDLSTNLTSNRSKFSSTFTAKELKSGSTAYIYVLCEIANLELDASFIGTANWELIDANDYEIPTAEIKSGKYVNSAIKGYANTDTKYNTSNTDVQSITFGNLSDYSTIVSSVATPIDISANNDGSVKVYRVGSSTYDVYVLATEPNTKIKFNSNSSSMFYKCSGLSELDVSNFDTSSVTDMSYMFYECSGLSTLDLSNFDTSNVTTMSFMFGYCSGLETIYRGSKWSTSKVTSGTYMFYNCKSLPNYSGSYITHAYCSRYMTLKS